MSGIAQEDSLVVKLLSPGQLKNFGKNALLQGDFGMASEYFERFMKLKPNHYKIAFQLAESFRFNRDYMQALHWYERSYSLSNKEFALPLYYYAQMLKMDGDCERAKEKFLAFRKQAEGDKLSQSLRKQVKNDIIGCDSLANLPLGKIAITHLDTSINKVHVEAAPIYLNDSSIVYSALRTDKREYIFENDTVNIPVRKLYTAKKEDGQWVYIGEFDGPFNMDASNVSGGSFSADKKRFYFTRCSNNWKNKVICAIYVSVNENGSWSEPLKLDKKINIPNFTTTQPTVSLASNGLEVVHFVSDRPNGRGGYDIWYFTYNSDKKVYSAPKNAGSKINTAGDEMTPFYDQEYGTLFFSSTGWPGFGGYDVFKSIGQFKKFTEPDNVNAPINSTYDDLYYTISSNRERGMIVSNRKGGTSLKNPTCCDDLYEYQRLEFINIKIAGNVFGGKDSTDMQLMEFAKVNVYLVDTISKEMMLIKTFTTNDKSAYEIPLEAGNTYKFIAEKDGYFNNSWILNTAEIKESKTINHNFNVKEIPLESFRLENVYYETNKHDLTAESKSVLDTTLIVLLNENPLIKIEIGAHTDDVGSKAYNEKLSQKRAEGVVKYLISQGIRSDRLVAFGYAFSKPVAPNKNPDGSDNPEGREKNRRTEFKVIGKTDLIINPEDED